MGGQGWPWGVRVGHGRGTLSFPWLRSPRSRDPRKAAALPRAPQLSPGRVRGAGPARGGGTRVPPGVAAGVSPCPGKAGARGRAQETGSLGRSLYFRRSISGSGWLQASPTALRSPGTGWHGNTVLRHSPPAALAPLSPGLDFPRQCHAGLGSPQKPTQETPPAGASAGTPWQDGATPAPGQRDARKRSSTGAGTEGLRTFPPRPPQPRWCRGRGWQVPMGCSGWGWQVPVGCLGQEAGAGGGFGHPWHPLLRKRCSVPGPERHHRKANADSRGRGGGPAGLGEPRCPRGGRPVSANQVCIIKAGGFGLAAPVPPSPGGQRGSGRHRGGQGGSGSAGQCPGGAAGPGQGQDRLLLVASSPVTRGRRASWAWPGWG